MENAAHTLCGLALARAGADRLSPLATVAVVVGANLPDLDVLGYPFGGKPYYLCHHRGLTHSLLGLGVESLLLAGLIALSALGLRRLLGREGPPLRFRGLWLAAGIGLLSHLVLDSLNTYGVRPFLPFSEARFYGDMAFIVDPWLWLGFGFAACLGAPRPGGQSAPSVEPEAQLSEVEAALEAEGAAAFDEGNLDQGLRGVLAQDAPSRLPPDGPRVREGLARVGWGIAIFLGAALLFTHERAPAGVGWLWTIPFLAILAARHFGLVRQELRQRFAWAGLAAVCVYLAVLCGLQREGDARARAAIRDHVGAEVDVSTTHPGPAIPWRFDARVATREAVYRADVDLLGEVVIAPGALPRDLDHPGLSAVAGTREHVAWLSFARIPFVAQLSGPGEPLLLLLGDARYVPRPEPAWCNLEARPPAEANRER